MDASTLSVYMPDYELVNIDSLWGFSVEYSLTQPLLHEHDFII